MIDRQNRYVSCRLKYSFHIRLQKSNIVRWGNKENIDIICFWEMINDKLRINENYSNVNRVFTVFGVSGIIEIIEY